MQAENIACGEFQALNFCNVNNESNLQAQVTEISFLFALTSPDFSRKKAVIIGADRQ
jgi:hypothetical protein